MRFLQNSHYILENRKRSLSAVEFTDDEAGWKDISAPIANPLGVDNGGEYNITYVDWYSEYQYRLRLSVNGSESENSPITLNTGRPFSPENIYPERNVRDITMRWRVKENVYKDANVSYHLRWRQKRSNEPAFVELDHPWQNVVIIDSQAKYVRDSFGNRIYSYDLEGRWYTDYDWQVRACTNVDRTKAETLLAANLSCSEFEVVEVSIPPPPIPQDVSIDLSPVNMSKSDLDFDWSDVAGAVSYQYQILEKGGSIVTGAWFELTASEFSLPGSSCWRALLHCS